MQPPWGTRRPSASSAALFATRLIFGNTPPPVALQLDSHNRLGRDLHKSIEDRLAEDQVTVGILAQQGVCAVFREHVDDVVLIDATVAVEMLKHPLILTKPSDSKDLRARWVGKIPSNYGWLRK